MSPRVRARLVLWAYTVAALLFLAMAWLIALTTTGNGSWWALLPLTGTLIVYRLARKQGIW